jgi:hypothetical protein
VRRARRGEREGSAGAYLMARGGRPALTAAARVVCGAAVRGVRRWGWLRRVAADGRRGDARRAVVAAARVVWLRWRGLVAARGGLSRVRVTDAARRLVSASGAAAGAGFGPQC